MEPPIFESELLPLFISYQKRANFEKKTFTKNFAIKTLFYNRIEKMTIAEELR